METRPTTRTAIPHPAMTAQAAWLAVVNPALAPLAMIEPVTATPRDEPTCRLVEATAPGLGELHQQPVGDTGAGSEGEVGAEILS